MHSTKRLLSSSIKKLNSNSNSNSNHEFKKMILPPRSNWDTIQSAAQAVYSLFSHPESRDTFVQKVDQNVINPTVLGQMDFGFFMSLALHHDLNSTSSMFQKYDFDAIEFLEGSHVAMEEFQECLYNVDTNRIRSIEDIEKTMQSLSISNENDVTRSDDDSHGTNANDDDTVNILQNTIKNMEKRKETIEQIITQMETKTKDINDTTSTTPTTISTTTDTTKDENNNDQEENAEYRLKQMVSTQLLDAVDTQFATSVVDCYINDMLRMNYTLDSGKVLNVALMSARAYEVPPEDDKDNDNSDDKKDEKTEIMMDGSFSNDRGEEYPVIAQLEVLYTISQTFTRRKIGGKIMMKEDKEKDVNADSNTDSDELEDTRERTMETAWVGVLEGWLDGHQPLRWKLVDNRPAWEFPMAGR